MRAAYQVKFKSTKTGAILETRINAKDRDNAVFKATVQSCMVY